MRFGRSLVLLVAAVVACSAAVATGVAYALVRHDSPAAHTALPPVAFVGVLRDTGGKPVANASVRITLTDDAGLKVGQSTRVRQLAGAHTDASGRFTIRQSESLPIIRAMAAANGGWVNFELAVQAGGTFMPWSIPRKVSRHGWLASDNPDLSAALKPEQLTFKPLG